MFFNVSPSAAQAVHPRRPCPSRRENAFQHSSSFEPTNVDLDSMPGNLDLSIHHPTSSSGNRFASLAIPEPVHRRDRGLHASATHRRTRNSRGTKEAKRRRDVRRNRRKYAAHLLDEQLSRDIDETLNKMNIYPTPPVSIPRQDAKRTTLCALSTIRTLGSPKTVSAAPQLPPIKLHGLRSEDFDQLFMPNFSPPTTPPPMLAGVPSWCPSIPSFNKSGSQQGPLPLFFDLSSLPETKMTKKPESKCQELQLWSLNTSRYTPQKQSRFFPSSVVPKTTVKLPPTPWKQYIAVDCAGQLVTTSNMNPPQPFSIGDAVEKIVTAAAVAGVQGEDCRLPSAANLWHILTGDMPRVSHYGKVSQRSSWTDDSDEGGVSVADVDHELPPYELACNELPYVHSNALVGHANEVAERHTGNTELIDSAIYLADLISLHNGGNPPYELSTTQWPSTAHEPTPDIMDSSLATTLHVNEFSEVDPEASKAEYDDSTAHFTSEQDLFKQSEKEVISKTPAASACDLATFLSMGHVENCWCRDCEGTAEIVHESTPTDDEEGWLDWSDAGNEITTTPTIADDTAAEDWSDAAVEDDSYDAACCQSEEFHDWDEIVPCDPSHSRHVVDDMPENEFLGYWDDGIAFARENEFDWIWNV